MNNDEPFGLPSGTVRGTIALGFTVLFIYMGATAMIAPETLLALGGPAIGYYFASRQSEKQAELTQPRVEEVEPPYTDDITRD